MRGFTRKYVLLSDKIMCDHCCNEDLLGLYYFPEYEPYVTKGAVERVQAESSADYVNPAEDTAACFDDHCKQGCKVHAVKHAAAHTDALPDDALAEDILANVPAYDAQAAVRSALATWGWCSARAHRSIDSI